MEKSYLLRLELDKIVAMAQERAVCPETKARLLEEMPQTKTAQVDWLLGQTDAVAGLLLKNGSPRLNACFEADKAVRRAEKGGLLSMGELLNVTAALRNFAALSAWYAAKPAGEASAAAVSDLFYSIAPQPDVERAVTEAILPEEEMADTASDELYTLRRKIRAAENAIRDKLDAVVKNPRHAKHLQEALVSIRNGRFVVPVKAEARGEIPGVIHDVSQSGGTLFVEPAAVVEQNAKILQLRSAEQAEIERILGELSQRVADMAPLFAASWEGMLEADRRLAKATLGLAMNGVRPQVNAERRFSLFKARHPLLNEKTVVPVDICLGGEYDTLVVTGPNTGGKTVSLKTAGLLSAMAQMGYLLPAHDTSSVCAFENILVDIGDEQSIEQSLSTFSGHMKNITAILRSVNERSLVLLDELGAGTDPAEGAALAISIIEQAREGGALVMATTHYAEMKLFALDTQGVQNAGSEFDVETLRPTYRLAVGVPGRSNAFLIGERLGLPPGVIARARRHLSTEQRRFETVLAQLEDLKKEHRKQEEEIERLRHAAGRQLEEGQKKREALIRQGEAELEQARQRAKALAEEVQNAAFGLMDEMKRLEKDRRAANAQKVQRARQIAHREGAALARRAADGEAAGPRQFTPLKTVRVGQEVWAPQMNKVATVTKLPDKAGNVEIRVGAVRTKLPLAELAALPGNRAAPQKQRDAAGVRRADALGARASQAELNLLGKTVDEALLETDQFIDNAVMSKRNTVYVIHGRGTGALRAAVTQHLRRHKSVKSFRLGVYGEGEDGVTVVELR